LQNSSLATESDSYRIKTHEVQPRENLFAISKKYGVSVEKLKEWNNLKGNNLTVGQQLIISK
jgi:LysM repeat protein